MADELAAQNGEQWFVMRMMKIKTAVILAALIMGCAGVADAHAQAQKSRSGYTRQDLIKILKDEGYGSVMPHEKNSVQFKVDGKRYGLHLFDDHDLQLYYSTSGVEVSLDAVNRWNRDFRHARAYLDRQGDPVLEADLLAGAGLNDAQVKNFVSAFVGSVARFRRDLLEGK